MRSCKMLIINLLLLAVTTTSAQAANMSVMPSTPFDNEFHAQYDNALQSLSRELNLEINDPVQAFEKIIAPCKDENCAIQKAREQDYKLFAIQSITRKGAALDINVTGTSDTKIIENTITISADNSNEEIINFMIKQLKDLLAPAPAKPANNNFSFLYGDEEKTAGQKSDNNQVRPVSYSNKNTSANKTKREQSNDSDYLEFELGKNNTIKIPKDYQNNPLKEAYVKTTVFGAMMKEIGSIIYELLDDAFNEMKEDRRRK